MGLLLQPFSTLLNIRCALYACLPRLSEYSLRFCHHISPIRNASFRHLFGFPNIRYFLYPALATQALRGGNPCLDSLPTRRHPRGSRSSPNAASPRALAARATIRPRHSTCVAEWHRPIATRAAYPLGGLGEPAWAGSTRNTLTPAISQINHSVSLPPPSACTQIAVPCHSVSTQGRRNKSRKLDDH
jgi:hypothetical protein